MLLVFTAHDKFKKKWLFDLHHLKSRGWDSFMVFHHGWTVIQTSAALMTSLRAPALTHILHRARTNRQPNFISSLLPLQISHPRDSGQLGRRGTPLRALLPSHLPHLSCLVAVWLSVLFSCCVRAGQQRSFAPVTSTLTLTSTLRWF